MIAELPEKENQLEVTLDQADMFIPIDRNDPDFGYEFTEYYEAWRRRVRSRGFRYLHMVSDLETRIITIKFTRG